MQLTKKQAQFLNLLQKFIDQKGEAPTLEEMKLWLEENGWGPVRSLNSVKQYLDALEQHGAIRRERKMRGIKLVDRRTGERSERQISDTILIPLLASPVSCGAPTTFIDENAIDHLQVSPRFVRSRERTYAFRAEGDSMNQAGISDGDYVLIEATSEIQDGDIVLANVDNCGTLKRLRKSFDSITLFPESTNPEHKPIYLHPDDEFVIAGKVINVLKNS